MGRVPRVRSGPVNDKQLEINNICAHFLVKREADNLPAGKPVMNHQLIIIVIAAILAIIVLFWRFSSGSSYGKLQPSVEVTAAYESFQVNSRMNYYLSGPDLYPNALMGIDKDWLLVSDLWKKKELAPDGMRALVQGMQTRAMENLVCLQGFEIMDHRGMKIGTWFSLPGLEVLIRIKGDNRVEISTPPGDIYGRT